MNRPDLVVYVEGEWRLDIRCGRLRQPARDRYQAVGIPLCGLPAEMGHCLGKMQDMLTRTTADLQHVALRRQYPHEDIGDRSFVSFGRRTHEPAVDKDIHGFATHFAQS